MPRDIDFLRRHEVPLATLRRAADLAERSGVPAADALLANGLCWPERFYAALAHEIGAPFLHEVRDLAPSTQARRAITSGLAPLRPAPGQPNIVAAPRGETIGRLLEHGPHHGLAITTPTALRTAVFALHGEAIANEAANGLADATPGLSYRGGSRPGQKRIAAVALVLAVASVALLEGAFAWIAFVAGAVFLASSGLRLAACLERAPTAPERAPERIPDADLPVYTILAPLYREANVVPQLCAALMRLDYPRAKLDIKLLVEAIDDETASAVRALALPACFELVVAPLGEPRTKPRALNVALPLARGAFTVIYDAEDDPDPAQLRLSVAAFDRHGPDVACLQARLSIHNADDGWLPALFAVEYAALFDVVNPGLLALGMPIPLGGTSNHFRTPALQRIGGWDAWNVTEDADMGLRLAALGLATRDLPSTTWEEAPRSLAGWLGQRSRWMKGYMQTLVTHTRDPRGALRRHGGKRLLATWLLVGGAVASALLFPLSLAIIGVMLIGLPIAPLDPIAGLPTGGALALVAATLGVTTCLAGFLVSMIVALEALRRRGRRDLVRFVPLLPVYFILVSLGAWLGLADLIRRPSHWRKTSHGHTPAALAIDRIALLRAAQAQREEEGEPRGRTAGRPTE